jgi:hypothetical protein
MHTNDQKFFDGLRKVLSAKDPTSRDEKPIARAFIERFPHRLSTRLDRFLEFGLFKRRKKDADYLSSTQFTKDLSYWLSKFHVKTCAVCDSPIVDTSLLKESKSDCCSTRCAAVSPQRAERFKFTCEVIYGSSNPSGNEDVKRKIIETRERNGTLPSSPEVLEKVRRTKELNGTLPESPWMVEKVRSQKNS